MDVVFTIALSLTARPPLLAEALQRALRPAELTIVVKVNAVGRLFTTDPGTCALVGAKQRVRFDSLRSPTK
jgi:hypothetical protein